MSTNIGVDILVNLVDRLSRPLREAEATIANAAERMNRRLHLSMQVSGAGAAAAGVAYGAQRIVTSFTDSIRDVEQARGELATLGVQDLDLIVSRGREMQMEWAGVTSAAFVGAAYDIRSGISSLTDQGVADMTAAATVVARATRSEVATMTSLFAGAYGVFRNQFSEMTDSEWGDMFGASLSAAVQQFRTDGAAMQQSIESAGNQATLLGISMTEQLAVLGMMQGQMQSGEAGTALAAYARTAGRAQEAFDDLGGAPVRLLDEAGQLRDIADVMTDLEARYADGFNATAQREIQEAFGSDEAMRLIGTLWGQEAAIRANADALEEAGAQGAAYTEQMAQTRDDENGLSGLDRMGQGINVLWQAIGERLLPAVDQVIPYITAFTETALAWIDANPELVTQIGTVVVAIGAIAAVIAPVLIGIGGLIASWAVMSYGATWLFLAIGSVGRVIGTAGRVLLWLGRAVIPIVGRALLFMGRALMANPIGIAVALIAGAAYLIYQNWEPISEWFSDLWAEVSEIFGGVADLLGGLFSGDMARARDGIQVIWSGLQGFFRRIWEGIGGVFSWAYDTLIRPVLDALGITDQVEAAWSAMTGFFSGILGDIGTYFSGLGDLVAGVLTGDMDRARAGAETAWGGFSSFVDRTLTAIGGYYTFMWENVVRPVLDALGLTEPLTAAWTAVRTALDPILSAIGGFFSAMWDMVEPIISSLSTPEGMGAAWEAVRAALSAPVNAISGLFTAMWDLVEPVIAALSSPEGAGAAWEAVRAVLTAPLNWIGEKFEWLMGLIQPVLDALGSAVELGERAVGAVSEAIGGGDPGSVLDDPANANAGGTPFAIAPMPSEPGLLTSPGDPMAGIPRHARGGSFGAGPIIVGEEGPELRYESQGGYIAHNRALRDMVGMAGRARALVGGLPGIAARAVPALATVAAAAPAIGGNSVNNSYTYNMPISFDGSVNMDEVRTTIEGILADQRARAEAETRRRLFD